MERSQMGKTALNQLLSDIKDRTYPNRIINKRINSKQPSLREQPSSREQPAPLKQPSPRERIISFAKEFDSILEIGPFCNPLLTGSNVKYLDVKNKNELEIMAKEIKLTTTNAPHIDYISPFGDLSIVDEKFDAIISSHNIEHQPDLILHIQQVEQILKDKGSYLLLVPDKRYCFDHFIQEATLIDVIAAYQERRKLHHPTSFMKQCAFATHNDAVRHWKEDHFDPHYYSDMSDRIKSRLSQFDTANKEYVDCHAWQFTPESFASIVSMLNSIGLTRLKVQSIYETAQDTLEFGAVLTWH